MRRFILRWLSLVPMRKGENAAEGHRGESPHQRPHEARPYRAVELRAQGPTCGAARRLAGKRLLAAEAPALPLPGCTLRCACYYKQHADRRRAEPRRLADIGVSGTFYAGPERRRGLDRRRTLRPAEENYYDYMRRHAPRPDEVD